MIPHSRDAEPAPDSLPSADEVELMAYLDGELNAEDARRVRSRIQSDPHFAARYRVFQAINSFSHDHVERVFAHSKVDSIADDVMAHLEFSQMLEKRSVEETSPSFGELELMAYMDGELSPADTLAMEQQLAKNPVLQRQLRALQATGNYVRQDAPRMFAAMGADSIADSVMAALSDKQEKPLATVHSLDSARKTARTASLPKVRQDNKSNKTIIWVAFGSLVAVAASFFLFVQVKSTGSSEQLANGFATQEHKITSGIAPVLPVSESVSPNNTNKANKNDKTDVNSSAGEEVEMNDVAAKVESPELEIEDLGNASVVTGEGSPHAIIMNDQEQDEAGEGSNVP